MINDLISLNELNIDPKVKQLFISVFQKDPQSRPTALQLLNQPIISSAAEYGHYFDECYNSEDEEELETVPVTDCGNVLITDVPKILMTSCQLSLHSDELPQFQCINRLQCNS